MQWSCCRGVDGIPSGGGVGGVKWCWRMLWVLMVLHLVSLILVEGNPVPDDRRWNGAASGSSTTSGDDVVELKAKHEWKRRHKKASECRLGKNRYSLHDEWSPNLGPPFGVWSCVKCACEPVQKKKRIVAKVRCRNVKTECPKVACPDAVILPGACCKICPSNLPVALPQDEHIESSEELSGRDFAVLLNGRTSQNPMTTSRVATGRLSLRRGTLHFSFLLEEGAPPPESIHFLSETGSVLEILEAQPTPYEATNSRICGTWTRVPKEYKALLREEKIWVALYPPKESGEDEINGLVARYVGVDTEVFSALLVPSKTANQTLSGGGTAIISVDKKTDSLHVSLVFNGIFGPEESHNSTIAIELSPSRAKPPVVDHVILSKVATDLNRLEYRTTLGNSSLPLLTRGRVSMKVWSVAAPDLAIEGTITPRATCNVFSSVLSVPEPQNSGDAAPIAISPPPPPPHGAGWALLTVSNDGDFEYEIFIQGVAVSDLKLETKYRRGHRIVEELMPSYVNNWANGTYTRPTFSDLDALLRGKMEIVVSDSSNSKVLHGQLSPVSVTEALRSRHPILLSSPELPMAATVWMGVDAACVTHYDVKIAGPPPNGAMEPFWNLYLREEDTDWDPRLDMTKMDLETEVEGWELSAHTTMLTRLSLSRLAHGVTHLDLALIPPNNDTKPPPPLTGVVKGVMVPPNCLLDTDANSYEETITHPDDFCSSGVCIRQDDGSENEAKSHKCKDADNRVFEDGTSWQSPANTCNMCMCTKGKIKCQDVICPRVQCDGAMTPPNECCPVCPGDQDARISDQVCELNDQRYKIGSVWYPFLVPKGFDKCVTCTCQMTSFGRPAVNCSRPACPTLHCDDRMKENPPDSCCPRCRPPPPEAASPTADPDIPNNPSLTDEEYRDMVLERGGCLYRGKTPVVNGKEWHPRVASYGYYKCVTCRCKDGNITCDSAHCQPLTCQTMVQVETECCPRCADSTSLTDIYPPRREPPRNKKQNRKKFPPNHNQRRNSG